LRFENNNGNIREATKVLLNFGNSLDEKPIIDFRVLPKIDSNGV